MKRNQLSKSGAGGGMGSKSVGKATRYFTGQPSTKVNPAGVSQFGGAVGNHTMEGNTNYRGDRVAMGSMPAGGPGGVALGNATALSAGQGPGAGRQVSRSGSQGQHGPVAGQAPGAGRDILGEFGPDSPNVAGRR